MPRSLPTVVVCSLCAASVLVAGQLPKLAEDSAIAYSKTAANDPVARLQKRIDAGEVTLAFDEQRGYLPSLLRALEIPVSSQGLVFSRTSLQVDRIAPWSPRAIYFNDDVYVGWFRTVRSWRSPRSIPGLAPCSTRSTRSGTTSRC